MASLSVFWVLVLQLDVTRDDGVNVIHLVFGFLALVLSQTLTLAGMERFLGYCLALGAV
jgi:hypothetical protein